MSLPNQRILKKTLYSNMWVARDKSGEVLLYEHKPVLRNSGYWIDTADYRSFEPKRMSINEKVFNKVTFENSPIEISLEPVFK